jgi:hypothetical protein
LEINMARSVSMKKFESMKASAAAARKRASAGRSKMRRRAVLGVSAFALGKAESSGLLDRFPTVLGLPKTIMAGLVAGVVGEFTTGLAGDIADGITESAIAITGYQWGKGQSVSGGDAAFPMYDPSTASIVDSSPGLMVAGDDPELDELEAQIGAYEDELLAMAEEDDA